jgi:hypothetical protein
MRRISCDIDNQHVRRLKNFRNIHSGIFLLSIVAYDPELITSSYMYLAQVLLWPEHISWTQFI